MRKLLAIAIGVAIGLVLVSIGLPLVFLARQNGNPTGASYLHQLGMAAQIYAKNQSAGALPDSFKTLVTIGNGSYGMELTPDYFFNPRRGWPDNRSRWLEEHFPDWVDSESDFVWLGKGKKFTDQDAIIAYEKPATLGYSGVFVLYGNLDTKFLSLADTRKLIPQIIEAPPADVLSASPSSDRSP